LWGDDLKKKLKSITFIAITLLAGAIAGTVLGILNQGIVEPYIEQAIALENEKAAAAGEGEIINPIEFNNYRLWQRGGEIAAGTILGTSIAALFGIVFAYSRKSIPGSNNKKKALILAGIMWFVIFLVPALKYPANPPAVGDPETIYYRQSLYLTYLAISGFTALGVAFMYGKMKKVIKSHKDSRTLIELPIVIYAVIMITAYIAMPPNPDAINAPMDLVTGFRVASAITMSIFWGLLGMILGAFWDKTKPHETAKIEMV
jgi:predicted cobalt transporter CbtA